MRSFSRVLALWAGLLILAVSLWAQAPGPLSLKAKGTTLTLDPQDLSLHIIKEDNDYKFAGLAGQTTLESVTKTSDSILTLSLSFPGKLTATALITMTEDADIVIALEGQGVLKQPVEFPGSLTAVRSQSWVVPINEGLLIPANDKYFHPFDKPEAFFTLCGGHGLCMPMLGLTDGTNGLLVICETPNDAAVRFTVPDNKKKTSTWTFRWEPEKGAWGYERRLRLKLLAEGSYVSLAKAYREYAQSQGLLKTLREKARLVPAVDRLIGSVDLWYWGDAAWKKDPHPEAFGQQLADAGIRRVLWSSSGPAPAIDLLNSLGFLTGKYDIIQDVWAPGTPLPWLTHEGWPADLAWGPGNVTMTGWVARDKEGKEYPGGVICDSRGLDHLRKHVETDKALALAARFLDTTTASSLRECYNPAHPMTRTEDRQYKMAQLAYLSEEKKLVTGSETGVDMAVPYLEYFEGMMSLAPYRLADSGHDLFTYIKPGPDVWRFQVGPYYRIPLFELVYHDCVVTTWYWGDSSNREPEEWDQRDMLNALYGNSPLWICDPSRWARDKARYLKSYEWATTVARHTGYSEMLWHEFLTKDHTVQYAKFADGTQVWVNFGKQSRHLENGRKLKGMGIFAQFPDGQTLVK